MENQELNLIMEIINNWKSDGLHKENQELNPFLDIHILGVHNFLKENQILSGNKKRTILAVAVYIASLMYPPKIEQRIICNYIPINENSLKIAYVKAMERIKKTYPLTYSDWNLRITNRWLENKGV